MAQKIAVLDTALTTIAAPDSAAEGSDHPLRIDDEGRVWGHGVAQTASAANTYEDAASNQDLTLLASAARTTATTSSDQTNINGRGLHVVFDVTLDPAAASITLTIQGKDALSGKYYTILAGAAVAATGTTVYTVFPGAAETANVSANDILPRTWRISVAVADADSMTYSVGATVIV